MAVVPLNGFISHDTFKYNGIAATCHGVSLAFAACVLPPRTPSGATAFEMKLYRSLMSGGGESGGAPSLRTTSGRPESSSWNDLQAFMSGSATVKAVKPERHVSHSSWLTIRHGHVATTTTTTNTTTDATTTRSGTRVFRRRSLTESWAPR